ncbi:MAG: hypothetical protein ABI824_15745, partial [Acidobacteriota bacterium]
YAKGRELPAALFVALMLIAWSPYFVFLGTWGALSFWHPIFILAGALWVRYWRISKIDAPPMVSA